MEKVSGCNYGVLGVIYHSDASLAMKFVMTWIEMYGIKSKISVLWTRLIALGCDYSPMKVSCCYLMKRGFLIQVPPIVSDSTSGLSRSANKEERRGSLVCIHKIMSLFIGYTSETRCTSIPVRFTPPHRPSQQVLVLDMLFH